MAQGAFFSFVIIAFICVVSGRSFRDIPTKTVEAGSNENDHPALFEKAIVDVESSDLMLQVPSNGIKRIQTKFPRYRYDLSDHSRRAVPFMERDFPPKIKRYIRAVPASHENSEGTNQDSAERSSRSHAFSSHLLNFIFSQVKKGHVTSDLMTRWMTSITSAIAHGTISQSDFERFKHELEQLHHSHENHDPNACCWFG